ncbi:MAG TPA: hypothetical protein VGY54_11860, partial [Polyangiaceae bacterium]|nr:hypothetical protein [Polyangiaceae bacterium]
MVSIVADVLVIAGGIGLWRFLARRRGSTSSKGAASATEELTARRQPFGAMPCELGDVIVRRLDHDEAWLAGALVFSESLPIAALFVAPEVRQDRAVFVRAAARELAWLAPVVKTVDAPGGEPPNAIEHDGLRFRRQQRHPVHVERVGTGAPAVGDRAVVAEYVGAGADRMLVVAGTEATL